MKTLLFISIIPIFLCGCSSLTQPVSDVAMGAGGGALADYFSNGNPAITAAGAAGGVAVSEGLGYVERKEQNTSYQNGYEKGRSDAVKQEYWILVSQQKNPSGQSDGVRYYEIQIPEQTIDGTILEPTTKYIRIED
jgi:hypothetical protein